jgi:hypothetical protein
MTPTQRQTAALISTNAGTVNVEFEEAFSDRHQPSVLYNSVRFEVGRPDRHNTGSSLGGGQTQFKWWHGEFLFTLNIIRENGDVERSTLRIKHDVENSPDELKTETFDGEYKETE